MKLFYTLDGIVADRGSFSSSKSTEVDLEGSSDVCLISHFSVADEKSCFFDQWELFSLSTFVKTALFFSSTSKGTELRGAPPWT